MKITEQEPYRSFLGSKKSPETVRTYASILRIAREELGKEVHEATDEELEKFILNCRDIRKMSSVTLGTYKAGIGSFFKYLVKHKIRKDDPSVLAREIDTGKRSKVNPKALTEEQRQKVLDALVWDGGLKDYQMSLAVLFGFKQGFRRFEIAKVEWDHINWDDRELFVLGKGAKEATVRMSKELYDRLKDYRMLVDKAKVDSRWVLFNIGNPSKHQNKEVVASWYRAIGKRCGLDAKAHFTTHSGRHVFCTTLHEKGVADMTAIQMTRHESVEMLKRYSRVFKKEVNSEFDRAID